MNFGLCGVSCTGKSTLVNAIYEKFGTKIGIINEATRKEVIDYSSLKIHDEEYASTREDSIIFNESLIARQIAIELEVQKISKEDTCIESCDLNNLMYYLFFAARYQDAKQIDEMCTKTFVHIKTYYDLIFYIPFSGRCFGAVHRGQPSRYVLDVQDSILSRLIYRHVRLDVVKLAVGMGKNESIEFVMKELGKRGLN